MFHFRPGAAPGARQKQLAARLRTNQAHISRAEHGENMTLGRLEQFAEAFGQRAVVSFKPLGKTSIPA